jgi:dimethylamine monooxygenase subunit B
VSGGISIPVTVTAIETVAERIKRFTFAAADGSALPVFAAGAHTIVTMQDGGTIRKNPYSLMGPLGDRSHWCISVLRTLDSRGGSAFMHEKLSVGSALDLSYPVNLFPLDFRAKKHLLLAGGIGITPIMTMAAQLASQGSHYELHYAMRGRAQGAYWHYLAERHGPRFSATFDDEGQSMPLRRILQRQPLGTSLYVCGPGAMIDWALKLAREMGWPEESLHAERFLAPAGGKPFTVELAASKKTVTVGEHQSMLEAIESAGVDAPYLCRGGACGQCETEVHSFDGTLIHNDHFLSADEKASGRKIMPCVSRFEGKRLVLER